jgi:RNA polymerase sigma factor (sigma-70 family)
LVTGTSTLVEFERTAEELAMQDQLVRPRRRKQDLHRYDFSTGDLTQRAEHTGQARADGMSQGIEQRMGVEHDRHAVVPALHRALDRLGDDPTIPGDTIQRFAEGGTVVHRVAHDPHLGPLDLAADPHPELRVGRALDHLTPELDDLRHRNASVGIFQLLLREADAAHELIAIKTELFHAVQHRERDGCDACEFLDIFHGTGFRTAAGIDAAILHAKARRRKVVQTRVERCITTAEGFLGYPRGTILAEPIVFIVDDDDAVRRSLERLIKSVGLNVETFASAHEFLRREPPAGPACIVLDVRMPGLSGLDLQQELVTAKLGLPIIFMTGHGTVPMSVRAMKAGAVDFLQKPIDEQILLDAVHQAIDRDRQSRDRQTQEQVIRERAESLTPREREVFSLVVSGLLNKQVAAELGTSEKTIKVHRARVMQKMQADSLADLVRMAEKAGIRVD